MRRRRVAGAMAPDGPPWAQDFRVGRGPREALDAAQAYLEGAGLVSPGLAGRLERGGDGLVVHHGRLTTRIEAEPDGVGSLVRVRRRGTAPLASSRCALYLLGILGAIVGWVLAAYRNPLSPVVTAAVFLLAVAASVVALYAVDRSLERRSAALLTSLEDAVRGDPLWVLRREVQALERTAGLANGLLFYCLALVAEFVVFLFLMGDGSGRVDRALAVDVMRPGFLYPAPAAALFGLAWWGASRRVHRERLATVEARARGAAAAPRPAQ